MKHAAVLVDERESRAGDLIRIRRAQAFHNAFRQRGLPGAEVPDQEASGMFVQSVDFVRAHANGNGNGGKAKADTSIYGQESNYTTWRLAKRNLAIRGIDSQIAHGDTFHDARHPDLKADFILANPPFNVNAVDKDRLKDAVGQGRRYPFGLPRTDNANYLWIQLFYSTLNENGRAGFVMANSASDARASEQELRKQLIEARAVDVMAAVGPNMFYTVTLPCTLWFLDKEKQRTPRADKVLFLDARHVYRQVDRAHRDWTEGQIGFLANVVRLYRGEEPDFILGGAESEAKLKEVFGKKLKFANVPGLCKAARIKEIEAQGGLAEVLHAAATDPNRSRLQVVYQGVKPDLL